MIIKNKLELIKKGSDDLNRKGREIILDIIEKTIQEVLPRNLIKKHVKRDEITLKIFDYELKLDKIKDIYIVGGGKASGEMAYEIYDLLSDKIKKGVINVPIGIEKKYSSLKKIKIIGAGHPIPTESGMLGTKEMLKIIEKADENDLIICLISGGGSALMPLPANDISLDDLKSLTDILLKSGMTINEMNIIRKHCSRIKGGQFIKNNKAKFISLILSDVLNDPLDSIASGPTVPDESTFEDVKRIINKYCIKDSIPDSIKEYLDKAYKGIVPDTPKKDDPIFANVNNFIIGNLKAACEFALKYAKKYGIPIKLISTSIEGEASEVGLRLIDNLLNEESPILLIGGGETTVTIKGSGMGGRNQEMVLSMCRKIDINGIIVCSIGTDGIDGNSNAAGAIADYGIVKASKKLGLDIDSYLENNDSYNFFKKIGDGLIFTGYTGTNVNDIYMLLKLN
ncbi:MAG: glycerate kinase type-2 family protein [Candidatus Helarchaeota archaeon]